jgi:hypothetical protein
MNNRTVQSRPDSAKRKAQSHFESADARSMLVKKMQEDERKAVSIKTAKLRAQRLANEAESLLKAANDPAPASVRKASAKSKPRSA